MIKELKKAMATYEVTQLVEMTITHRVRAANSDEANDIATKRTGEYCQRISKRYSFAKLNFGDIVDDYIPAQD